MSLRMANVSLGRNFWDLPLGLHGEGTLTEEMVNSSQPEIGDPDWHDGNGQNVKAYRPQFLPKYI